MNDHTLWECPECKRGNLSWRTVCLFCGWRMNGDDENHDEESEVDDAR